MLKLGIIGLGDIAAKAYLPVISSMKELELHLFTRNEEKLEEISQRYRFSNIHPSLKFLIKSGINAAFVHSSTESHYEIVKELLLNDIHVYVDKPITYHFETTKELVEIAETRKLILMTGFNRRFAPAYQALREVVNPNMLIMQKNRHSLPGDIRTFVFDDFIHVIDTVRYLMNDDEILNLIVHGRKKGDLLYHVTAQFFSNDSTGIAIMNRDSGSEEEKVEIMGPDEKRTVHNLTDLIIHSNNKDTKLSFNNWDTTLFKRGFEQIIAEFITSVRTNTFPSVSTLNSLLTHEICEKIVRELEN
ncbi:Gfo/Idh/MocA family protein [Neobacillus ginsengisoli]|uniref:Virulence factor n=1 Tax=Neobacillus ginsengisoli TaxID=904295 RepID=A0ABT9XWR7_9BACI|nr:Gfo/Idh/MocA family oxidoreductase [Neobacillus ginsengisoli]MDQ0200020.1 virulence factor [Neobacillus ginsengisoli]